MYGGSSVVNFFFAGILKLSSLHLSEIWRVYSFCMMWTNICGFLVLHSSDTGCRQHQVKINVFSFYSFVMCRWKYEFFLRSILSVWNLYIAWQTVTMVTGIHNNFITLNRIVFYQSRHAGGKLRKQIS